MAKRRFWVLVGCVVLAVGVGAVCFVARQGHLRSPSTASVEALSASEQARIREPFERGEQEATNSIGMRFRLVPAGEFRMGSGRGYDDEKPVHRVTVSRPFYLGVHEVTQAQYEKMMGSNPSHFRGPGRPVEDVTWNDAREFCRRLSVREGVEYRLPTEAEWEHSCRAGGTTKYCFGDLASGLADYAWFAGNSGNQTHEVGQKRPNAWGLHDMHGNVWEWCQDWFGPYTGEAQTDPRGPGEGTRRVLRGGPWGVPPDGCRSAYRNRTSPDHRHYTIGLRVVRPLP